MSELMRVVTEERWLSELDQASSTRLFRRYQSEVVLGLAQELDLGELCLVILGSIVDDVCKLELLDVP